MIIYNRKMMMQAGAKTPSTNTTTWYQDPNVQQAGNQMAEGVNSQGQRKQYSNTATQGNMNAADVEKVDPDMENQGETTSALTGAATGAISGAAAGSVVPGIGTAVGAVVGGVVGGLSSWLSTDSANDKAYDAAQDQYKAGVNQAESNYQANAQNRYASQYQAYQDGGQMGVGQNQPVNTGSQPVSGIVNNTNQMPMNNTNQMPMSTNTNTPMGGRWTGRRKNGGTFNTKIDAILTSSTKK